MEYPRFMSGRERSQHIASAVHEIRNNPTPPPVPPSDNEYLTADEYAAVLDQKHRVAQGEQGEQDIVGQLSAIAAAATQRAIARVGFAKDVQNAGRFTRLTVEDTLRLEMEQAAHAVYVTKFATVDDLDRLIASALALRSVTPR